MASSSIPSALQLYLKQINRTPLLTAEDEKHLARMIIDHGCMESRERMISANLRLVVAIAKKYVNRGLPMSDLVEEGNVGLVKAVENFDPSFGARFSTYAAWWIKQAIKRALINAGQPIHVPAYMVELVSKWRKAKRDLEERLGHAPTIQELSAEMSLPERKINAIHDAVRAFRRPSRGVVGDDGELIALEEMLEDSDGPSPEDPLHLEDELATLSDLLEDVDEREATILRLRFGLDGEEPMTLKEIGRQIGLTRERVRQLEIEALRKLWCRLDPEAAAESDGRPRRRRRVAPRA